jgi:predicted acetyltransferase
MTVTMTLIRPTRAHLPSYIAALERGWSPDNVRAAAATRDELQQIAADADAFLASLEDRDGQGPPIVMPDGTLAPRLPGFRRWMWDGEFAGSIGFRWQPGTPALPPYCLGHVGYAVVPWKQNRGYATAALRMILPSARAEGLAYVELTTDPENLASQRVILSSGGVLVEQFRKLPVYGGTVGLRYRIPLDGIASGAPDDR